MSKITSHADDKVRVSKAVPGPGYYDTDHLFGTYQRILSGSGPPSRPQTCPPPAVDATLDEVLQASDTDVWLREQQLVMSRKVPSKRLLALSTTRYTRLRKDTTPVQVRIRHRTPPRSRSVLETSLQMGSEAGSSPWEGVIEGLEWLKGGVQQI